MQRHVIELEVDVRDLTAEIPRHTSSCDWGLSVC